LQKMSENREKAKAAMNKPASFGVDLDLSEYSRPATVTEPCPVSTFSREVLDRALRVGVDANAKDRSGTYFQSDRSVVLQSVHEALQGKVEIMSTPDAIKKYDWLKDYWWRIVPVDADKYTAIAELEWDKGYFIRVLRGQKLTLPIQSCLLISQNNLDQNVHNVIIAEPNSEAQIITGCTIHPNVRRGLHVGISEFYVKENAKLTFTMIHSWGEGIDVRPRSAAIVENNAIFISNYLCTSPVKTLQTYPAAYCRGNRSRAIFNTILYGRKDSKLDVGSKIVLQGKDSAGEVMSRAIADENSEIYARGMLVGENRRSRAHLECRGLLLSRSASVHAIPELVARAEGTELSHEAAVGKISEEQIEYLMARGLSEPEATSLIVTGFMDVEVFGLPGILKEEIKRAISLTAERAI
jgi:Fe-S cluster assembly scaffold protein SufB